jgi:hypothetical protein
MRPRLLAALAVSAAALGLPSAHGGSLAPPRFEVVAHVAAPGGYSGDVAFHRGHVYLSSHKGTVGCPAQGVRVYDLADPRRPQLRATFADRRSEPALARTWTEKTIVRHVRTSGFSGELAVTSVQGCDASAFRGFALYDVTSPQRPRRLALVRTDPRGSHEIWLQQVGRRAYVYTAIILSEVRSSPDAATPGLPDFRIFDVSDPRRPAQVGGWGAWRTLGIHPFQGRGTFGAVSGNLVHSVITNRAGTRAFLSYWDLGTVILDISRPSRPRYVGRTTFPRGAPGDAHSAWLDERERLLVETHETTGGRPTFFDVSNPRRPVRLAEFALPRSVLNRGHAAGSLREISGLDLTDSVHDPKVARGVAYFSWYAQGVVAADISNPRRPRFLARFLPPAARDPEQLLCPGSSCVAVLGVDLAGEYVLASDAISGLWVLRFRRPA